jgi:ribonuclease P protein component
MDHSFGKNYKICSKKQIDLLFSEGILMKSFPFVLYYREAEFEENVPFQFVFSAPKRSFKRAHDRNFIKRLFREVVQRRKTEIEALFPEKKMQYFLIYSNRELPNLLALTKDFDKLLVKLMHNQFPSI